MDGQIALSTKQAPLQYLDRMEMTPDLSHDPGGYGKDPPG